MKLYNTISGQKEHFSTTDSKVRMYVCGITPYGQSHIGHAMFSVVFDVVRRYLEFKGYEVQHVQNFTDIDDKVIQAAAEAGISTEELADGNIQAYLGEMDSLNVLRAHNYPRATQEMSKILEMIEALVQKGFAYAVDGDVYFRVRKDREYGKLSHQSLENILVGARVEINENKEEPIDFALWKSQESLASLLGTALGAQAGLAGTSSAPPCPWPTWAKPLTSTAGDRIWSFPTMRMSWHRLSPTPTEEILSGSGSTTVS